jgi:hypothetical protein
MIVQAPVQFGCLRLGQAQVSFGKFLPDLPNDLPPLRGRHRPDGFKDFGTAHDGKSI